VWNWNPKVLELALIALLACFGVGLAWAHEADFFAKRSAHQRRSEALRTGCRGLQSPDKPVKAQ
jgi:hypothetical protein